MTKTIFIETEYYQDGGEGDFYVPALTGDTYDAREVIKSLGDFHFSEQIGHGKAWRAPVIFKRDMVPGNGNLVKMQGVCQKAIKVLTDAGYKVVRR